MLSSIFIPGALSRAVFVAALAIAAFALFRYRQSLVGTSRRLRWLMVGLRGAALLLAACALGGVSIEHETATGARVLLWRQTRTADSVASAVTAETMQGVEEQRGQGIVSALERESVSVVETKDAAGAGAVDGGPFVAGVMLTDGAMRTDDAALEVERLSAAAGGAPVFVVGDYRQSGGPTAAAATVALESVLIMGSVVRGVPVAVRCVVHGRGMRGRESLVSITDDAKVQASASVAWRDDDERQTVTLSVVPKVAGWTSYAARIEAAGGEDKSLLSRPITLYAVERRWRVLFFEGEPTWEAKFIRRALERSKLVEVDYFAQVSRAAMMSQTEKKVAPDDGGEAGADDSGVDDERDAILQSPETRLRAVLASVERLNSYDCIIVGTTPNEMLSAAEAARLRVWTEKRGGGLVITGGNSFADSIVAPNGKLYGLMPTAIDPRGFARQAQAVARDAPLEAERTRDALALLPTAAGASVALGAYLNALQATPAARADVLTGQGLRLGALRPGASVLAVAGRGSDATTSETGTPLIAATRYGAGRALVFAPADSWRLHTTLSGEQDETDTPYSALWQGLMLWATAGARPPVEITLSDESPAAGRRLTAELRVRDANFTPAGIETLSARLQPLKEDEGEASADSTTPREIAFAPDERDKSVWRASLDAPAPGPYMLEADYTANGKRGSVVKHFAVVSPQDIAPGAALDTLSRSARETGGGLLTSDSAETLARRIKARSFNSETTRRTWELRTWWPLALIIPLLLSAAWLIERMNDERGTPNY